MGRFNGVRLTSKGLRLQAKVQTGEKLNFKGVVVGTGYLPETADIISMTELISPVSDAQTDVIGNKVTGDGFSQLEVRITSGATAFYLREIGIIATDPDEGDILYAYTNAGDYADFIPASVDNITTQDITIVTAIGNAKDVNVNITLDVEVRREEFERHVSNRGNPHGVTAGIIGLGNVTNESKETMFESPIFTGIPTAPTASAGTKSAQVATTKFIHDVINNNDYSLGQIITSDKTQYSNSGIYRVPPMYISNMPTISCIYVFTWDDYQYNEGTSNIYLFTFDIRTGKKYSATQDSYFNITRLTKSAWQELS